MSDLLVKPRIGMVDWAAPINQGLICWYLMSEREGLNVYDITGKQTSGAFTNGPTWDAGVFNGPAVAFDQTATKEITLPTINGFNGAEGTIYLPTFHTATTQFQNMLQLQADSNNVFQIQNLFLGGTADFNFVRKAGGTTNSNQPAGQTINKWLHYVCMWSIKAGTVITYLNGQVLSTASSVTATFSGAVTANYYGNSNAASRAMVGKLDGLRIWNRALSAPEVARLYANGLIGLVGPRRLIISRIAGFKPYWASQISGVIGAR